MIKRFLAILFAIAVPSFAAELYDVRIHRSHKAGEKFSVFTKASVDGVTTFSANDRVVREQKLDASCSVEGELEILKVDDKGRVRSASMKVTKAEGKVDGSASQVFKPGDVILAKRGEKGAEEIEINGEKPSEVQGELAGVLVPTSRATKVTDDDIFSPGRGVGVGEEWAINSKAAVDEFDELGKLSPDDIKGTIKLSGVEEADGQKCLKVRGQLSIKGSGFSVPNMPDFIKVRTMEVEADIDSSVPVDTTVVIPRTKTAMTMDIAASGETEQDGQRVKVSLSVHRKKTSDQRFKAIK